MSGDIAQPAEPIGKVQGKKEARLNPCCGSTGSFLTSLMPWLSQPELTYLACAWKLERASLPWLFTGNQTLLYHTMLEGSLSVPGAAGLLLALVLLVVVLTAPSGPERISKWAGLGGKGS